MGISICLLFIPSLFSFRVISWAVYYQVSTETVVLESKDFIGVITTEMIQTGITFDASITVIASSTTTFTMSSAHSVLSLVPILPADLLLIQAGLVTAWTEFAVGGSILIECDF